MHDLSQRAAAELALFAVDGDWAHLTSGGELRVLDRPLLPGQAVAVVRQGALLWVIIDMAQEDALGQLRELMACWPMSILWEPFDRPVIRAEAGVLVH